MKTFEALMMLVMFEAYLGFAACIVNVSVYNDTLRKIALNVLLVAAGALAGFAGGVWFMNVPAY